MTRFVRPIDRLAGTRITTDIRTGDDEQRDSFGLIDAASIRRKHGDLMGACSGSKSSSPIGPSTLFCESCAASSMRSCSGRRSPWPVAPPRCPSYRGSCDRSPRTNWPAAFASCERSSPPSPSTDTRTACTRAPVAMRHNRVWPPSNAGTGILLATSAWSTARRTATPRRTACETRPPSTSEHSCSSNDRP